MSAIQMPVTHAPTPAAARDREGRAGVRLPLAALTIGRLALVPFIVATFLVQPAITTIALGLFVVVDVYDGVIARRLDADDTARRALDSVVDRIAVDACLIGACAAGAIPPLLLAAFLARDVFLAGWCLRMVQRLGVAIRADWLYRSLNLSIVAWALSAPFVSAGLRTGLCVLLLAFAIAVAADLVRSIRRLLRMPSGPRGRVVAAGDVRRGLV